LRRFVWITRRKIFRAPRRTTLAVRRFKKTIAAGPAKMLNNYATIINGK
jgi:hypothetical protein